MNFEQEIIISRIKEYLNNIKLFSDFDVDKFFEIIKKYNVLLTGFIFNNL